MSWLFNIFGGSSTAGIANVDANFNLAVNPPMVGANAGFTSHQIELDSGSVTGTRNVRQLTGSVFNRQSVGIDSVIFSDYFNAAAQNTAQWHSATTTFTFGFNVGGYLQFNNGLVTTASASQIYQSTRTFTLFGGTPLMFEFSEFRTAVQAVNQQAEVGLFLANLGSTPFTPSDGAYIRFNSTGAIGVLNYNGTESTINLLSAGQIVTNDNTTYRIIMDHYRVEFWGASATSNPRVLLGVLPVPAANGPPFSSLNAPVSMRLFNNGTAASATILKIANIVVVQQDISLNKPWAHQLCGQGLMAYQGQNGGTMGTTASYANNAAPAAAALSNTAANITGLGGQAAVNPTLAANTDGIVCSFQNPATAVAQTGRTLYITGIRIHSAVTTVLANTAPVVYAYSLAFGHTAVSMATAEGVAAKAPRRIAIGFESFGINAAVGTLGSAGGLVMTFQSPIVVNASEFVAVCAKNIGTVTTSGVVAIVVCFDAFFE